MSKRDKAHGILIPQEVAEEIKANMDILINYYKENGYGSGRPRNDICMRCYRTMKISKTVCEYCGYNEAEIL